jgi:hypothetical protein
MDNLRTKKVLYKVDEGIIRMIVVLASFDYDEEEMCI